MLLGISNNEHFVLLYSPLFFDRAERWQISLPFRCTAFHSMHFYPPFYNSRTLCFSLLFLHAISDRCSNSSRVDRILRLLDHSPTVTDNLIYGLFVRHSFS